MVSAEIKVTNSGNPLLKSNENIGKIIEINFFRILENKQKCATIVGIYVLKWLDRCKNNELRNIKVTPQGHRLMKKLRTSHRTTARFPSPHIVPPHLHYSGIQGSCMIQGNYIWKNSTSQTLFKKKSSGKPIYNSWNENKDTRRNFSFWHIQLWQTVFTHKTMANMPKVYLPQFFLLSTSCPALNRKFQGILKDKNYAA